MFHTIFEANKFVRLHCLNAAADFGGWKQRRELEFVKRLAGICVAHPTYFSQNLWRLVIRLLNLMETDLVDSLSEYKSLLVAKVKCKL